MKINEIEMVLSLDFQVGKRRKLNIKMMRKKKLKKESDAVRLSGFPPLLYQSGGVIESKALSTHLPRIPQDPLLRST